jgi:hypothetical protein
MSGGGLGAKIRASMPDRPCPRCQRTGRFLKDTSALARVDYYRGDFCGEVWCLDKRDETKPPVLVTQPPKEPRKTGTD